MVPERDSSLYDVVPPPPSGVCPTFRRHSNSSSTEADEESSLSSLNSHRSEISPNEIPQEIEEAKEFPPPPSPTTLRRPPLSSAKGADPRLDDNFSSVIAQRAAEAKARRHKNPSKLEFRSNGLPPSTTFFNNCVTTNTRK